MTGVEPGFRGNLRNARAQAPEGGPPGFQLAGLENMIRIIEPGCCQRRHALIRQMGEDATDKQMKCHKMRNRISRKSDDDLTRAKSDQERLAGADGDFLAKPLAAKFLKNLGRVVVVSNTCPAGNDEHIGARKRLCFANPECDIESFTAMRMRDNLCARLVCQSLNESGIGISHLSLGGL